jgi:flavodoxin
MYALVVYDSQFGNTERIATAIADTLRTSGNVRTVRVDPAQPIDMEGVDLLILGSPTQGWRPTVAMQSFLGKLTPEQLHGRAIACFDTRFQKPRWMTGSAARVMANQFLRMKISLLMSPESFFVEHTEGPLLTGELGRAAVWARALLNRLETPQTVLQR